MMKYIYILFLINGQFNSAQSDNKNSLMDNNFGANSGLYINNDNNGLYIDGYFELQSKQGYFTEIAVNDYYFNRSSNQYYSFSVGFLKNLKEYNIIGIGYSNYFDNFNEINHELFIGSTYKDLSAITYLDFEEQSIKYYVLVNLNSYIVKIPFDMDLSLLNANYSTDIFFRISKSFKSGLSVGYVISKEDYESNQKVSYKKNGIKGEYSTTLIEPGIFNEIYIGISF